MAVLINDKTRVIVQGITGREGSFHTKLMKEYGTKIVAGVTPGKGGLKEHGIPVYNSVKEALKEHDADFSVLFVPAKFVKKAAIEALENGLNLVIITEGVPVQDEMSIINLADKKKLTVIGPNCPGIFSPGLCKLGIMPSHVFKKGNIGVVSRSGTLTYEVVAELVGAGLGQSSVIGIGGDAVIGTNFVKALELFEKDKDTSKIVMIGEIGGTLEEDAAKFIKKNVSKKVVSYITGATAPKGKRMGHAGAIVYGKAGTAESKIKALEKVGVKVAKLPSEIVKLL